MILTLILAIFAGISVKYADWLEDNAKKKNMFSRIVSGMVYGFLIFLTIKSSEQLAFLWIGIIFGVILSGKIDGIAHYAGIIVLFLLIAVTGVPKMNVFLLAAATLICFCEEKINDMADKKKKNKIFYKIMSLRLFMEIFSFIYSLITGIWIVWLSLLSFDIGYLLLAFLSSRRRN